MIDLRAIRGAADIGPTELAAKMGFTQRSGKNTVLQIEGRKDWLLSTLAAYFTAAGASAELVVKVAGEEFRFTVA